MESKLEQTVASFWAGLIMFNEVRFSNNVSGDISEEDSQQGPPQYNVKIDN